MDRPVIEQKLESLRRCLKRIQDKCPENAAQLALDLDAQDILALNLTRAIQLCVDIAAHLISTLEIPAPNTMGQSFEVLVGAGLLPVELAGRLKKAVGFRNIAVHNYEAINWEVVFAICQHHLGDFKDFASQVRAVLLD